MIVSNDLVIGTPTKCGTHSVEAMAKKAKKYGFDVIRSMHRMDVPPEHSDKERVIVVRNPYDRLVSIYHYLHAEQNYSQWGARYAGWMSFDEFVAWFAAEKVVASHLPMNTHRAPHLWTNSLTDNSNILDAIDGLKLEEIDHWREHVFGLERTNWGCKSQARKAEGWTVEPYFENPETLKIANAHWCDIDCRMWGYERMG